jgi:hypothetical protein
MNSQRKLTALLYELQHARSPLAQARVLARAWRTVRELSPTDRRLLARNAGFDGAEEILEGLSRRKGGLAPATLLRVLANARGTDGSAVSELLAAFRDPERRGEAISLGAELASDLLGEPPADEATPEIGDAIEELQAVEASIIETPEEALAALTALEPEADDDEVGTEPEPEPEPDPIPAPEAEAQPPPPVVDWSRWREPTAIMKPAPTPREEMRPPGSERSTRRFEARAVMGAMGAQKSVFSQLRVLRRELSGFAGSRTDTLRELIETFPDGWARRRALSALLENGIPSETRNALELVSCLDRELDRRWCLGLLARRGDLRGANLDRALELLESEYSKRRLAATAV